MKFSPLERYRTKLGEYNERFQELEKATSERDSKRAEVDFLRKQRRVSSQFVFCTSVYLLDLVLYFRLDEFMAGFSLIAIKLKEMYQVGN